MTDFPRKEIKQIDTIKLTAWYNFQAPFYHFWRDQYNEPLIKCVADLIDGSITESVLDAGCGSGLYSIGLGLLKANWRIEGIDYSRNLLRIARAQALELGLQNIVFTNANVLVLPYHDQQFSLVIAAGLFPNLDDQDYALHEIARVLRRDGQLVIVEFDREGLGWTTKLFFKLMIFGYHIFTTVFRQYRFAKKWDITTSTINKSEFENLLLQTGFTIKRTVKEHQHVIFLCRKP